MKSAGWKRTIQNVNMIVPQVNHEKSVLSLIIYHNSQAIRCIHFPDKYCKKIPHFLLVQRYINMNFTATEISTSAEGITVVSK